MVRTSGQPESRKKWYPKETNKTRYEQPGYTSYTPYKGCHHHILRTVKLGNEYERVCIRCGKVVESGYDI